MSQHPGFQQMDKLSGQKKAFFFLISFLMDEVRIYSRSDIENQKILIDFPQIKNVDYQPAPIPEFTWQSIPKDIHTYQKGFDFVKGNLMKGNSYLANYTMESELHTSLDLGQIFRFSKAKYKVMVPDEFVFFSPETFVEINDNHIFTYPMKGTIDASTDDAENVLKSNPKELAEHYTVVDLLRNDLSMVADDVKVKDFRRIDYIRSQQKNLLAMSSEIEGEIKPEFRSKIGTVLKKLLPAGSILGAPKAKTLEIIRQAENYQRCFYTGIAGYFDGQNLDSCVMIRFIEKRGHKLYFKSGGGITHKSDLVSEYEELKNKIYVPIY